jgi:ABC-2 type transport system permease protein
MRERHARGPLPALPRLLAGQLRYQLRLLLRTPRAAFGGVLLPVLLLLIRGHGDGAPASGQRSPAIGLAVLGVVSTAYVTHAGGLVAAREAGVLKRWRAAPLPPWCWFAGWIGATVLLAVAGGAVTLLAGALVDDLSVSAGAAIGLLLALSLGATAWASIGTAACTAIPSAESAWPLLGASYLPLLLLSDGFGAVDGPDWLAALMRYLPAQPVIDAATHALHQSPGGLISLPGRDLAVLTAWTAAGVAFSVRRFRWQPR